MDKKINLSKAESQTKLPDIETVEKTMLENKSNRKAPKRHPSSEENININFKPYFEMIKEQNNGLPKKAMPDQRGKILNYNKNQDDLKLPADQNLVLLRPKGYNNYFMRNYKRLAKNRVIDLEQLEDKKKMTNDCKLII